MEIRRVTVTIKEDDDCWVLYWPDGQAETHKTAAEAHRAVQDFGKVLAGGGISNFLKIEWWPASSIGRSVIKALA